LTLAVGQRLGHFEVLAALGAGGMGEVYRARDLKLGRDVALKVLPATFAGSAERRGRFSREAKLLATLNHPAIASLYEVQEHGDSDVLVMELVEGETLADHLARGALPLKRVLEVGRRVAEALEGAHDRGILHRDLKPANIMLTPAGGVKLLDFGLATALEEPVEPEADTVTRSQRMGDTAPGVALGTVPYMSPEQARAEDLDRRTDVWAFGCVLYEMLTGRRAFSGPTRSDVMAAVLEKEPDWEKRPARADQEPALERRSRRMVTRRQEPDLRAARSRVVVGPADGRSRRRSQAAGVSQDSGARDQLQLFAGWTLRGLSVERRGGPPAVSRPGPQPAGVGRWRHRCPVVAGRKGALLSLAREAPQDDERSGFDPSRSHGRCPPRPLRRYVLPPVDHRILDDRLRRDRRRPALPDDRAARGARAPRQIVVIPNFADEVKEKLRAASR